MVEANGIEPIRWRTLLLHVFRTRSRSALALGLGGILLLAACQGASNSGTPSTGDELSGEIIVSGSSTVEPITSIVLEDFAAEHPDVTYEVDGKQYVAIAAGGGRGTKPGGWYTAFALE